MPEDNKQRQNIQLIESFYVFWTYKMVSELIFKLSHVNAYQYLYMVIVKASTKHNTPHKFGIPEQAKINK